MYSCWVTGQLVNYFTFSRDINLAHVCSSVITDGGLIDACSLQWKLVKQHSKVISVPKKTQESKQSSGLGSCSFTNSITVCKQSAVPKCNYQFNWQFADSCSKVRLHVRDDLFILSVPVELWLLLQISNLWWKAFDITSVNKVSLSFTGN